MGARQLPADLAVEVLEDPVFVREHVVFSPSS
jgi:hypothetical protein